MRGRPRAPEGSSAWLRSKGRSSRMPARERVTCVRALRYGCATPDPAVDARVEDSRAEDQESLSFAGSETFLTCCCLGFHHWRNLAGLASASARDTSVTPNWTGSCITCDR